MNLKRYAAQNHLILFIRLFTQYWHVILLYSKELAQSATRNNRNKSRAGLMMKFHSIEKGLSTGETRAGFGQEKIISALEDLFNYYRKFNDSEFVLLNLAIVDEYLKFNRELNVTVPEIIGRTNLLYDLLKEKQ